MSKQQDKGKNIEEGVDNPAFIDENEIIKENTTEEKIDLSDSEFEDLEEPDLNIVQKSIEKIHKNLSKCSDHNKDTKYKNKIKYAKWILIFILFKIYFIGAIIHHVNSKNSFNADLNQTTDVNNTSAKGKHQIYVHHTIKC